MGYYERIWVAQLVFALAAIFGAFFAGLAVGYWRWAKREERVSVRSSETPARARPKLNPSLFSADERHDAHIDSVPAVSGFSTAPSEIEAGVDHSLS